MTQTKFKLTVVGMVLLTGVAVGLFLAGVKDPGVWTSLIVALAAMPTQYSGANALITTKAIGKP